MEVLKSTIQDMEKERDFYFGKLRNIELICQEKEGEEDPTLNRIIDILYATDVSSCVFKLRFRVRKAVNEGDMSLYFNSIPQTLRKPNMDLSSAENSSPQTHWNAFLLFEWRPAVVEKYWHFFNNEKYLQ